MNYLLTLAFSLTSLGAVGTAFAKKNCTEEPKLNWMKEDDFKKKVTEQGYTIRKFKTPGSCYEIYGSNKEGQNVEVYFNPVTAEVVKQEIKN
jgi:hypothetical protein